MGMDHRVIFSLLDTPAVGGAEAYLFDALSVYARRGDTVVLATNNQSVKTEFETRIRKEKYAHFSIIALPYRLDAIGNWKGFIKYLFAVPINLVWIWKQLKKLQQNDTAVVCFLPGYTDRLTFSPLIKKMGCKLIWLEYGPLEETFQRNFGFPRLLYAMARPYVDRVVTISRHTQRSLIETGKIPPQIISIIYPPVHVVDPHTHEQLKKHGQQLLDIYGWSTPYAIAVGRLADEKEFDVLLHAWAQAGLNFRLLIVGTGPKKGALEKIVKKHNLEMIVKFTGYISSQDRDALLSCATFFIFPSAWELEGFGMTTIEAVAAHIPVITSGSGPQKEIIPSALYGWHFTPHSVHSLSHVLTTVLQTSAQERAKRSQNAYRHAITHFSNKSFEESVRKVVSGLF